VMELPEYAFSVSGRATTWGLPVAQPASRQPFPTRGKSDAERRRTALSRLLTGSAVEDTGSYDRNAAVHALSARVRLSRPVGHHPCRADLRHALPGAMSGPPSVLVPTRQGADDGREQPRVVLDQRGPVSVGPERRQVTGC
jgi:hypothetical protein